MSDKILILGDERPGTVSQSIALAQELEIPYEIVDLKYNKLAKIPNIFFSQSLMRLDKKSRQLVEKIQDFPKLIISAGRKSATIANYLKSKSQGQSKIIQIMNPNMDLRKFDSVILPYHDGIFCDKLPNIINIIGAITKIDEEKILQEKEKFAAWFETNRSCKIALMLGGSSKKTNFTPQDAINLGKIVSQIVKNMNAKLFVLNSPRSGASLTQNLLSNLDCDHEIFDWEKLQGQNPYLASLAIADFFIITGDSVSMISQCCSTGKPVYIFDEAEISSKKHRKFHQNLLKENYIKKLDLRTKILENFHPKKLEETKRVAEIIKKNV